MTRIFEFPDIPGVTADLRLDLVKRSRQLHVPQGAEVFAPGRDVAALLILLPGTLRVEQEAETGREIVLYRSQASENCVLTTACLPEDSSFAATAITETDLDLLLFPKTVFDDLMIRSSEFRRLIFQTYSKRITDLMQMVENVACRRINMRLAGRLIDFAGDGTRINATQRQISAKAATARGHVPPARRGAATWMGRGQARDHAPVGHRSTQRIRAVRPRPPVRQNYGGGAWEPPKRRE
ncbi:Crp/Fnr family transcriptional regulator [Sulfitobacter sp.]|uniref:Crp/Fnr family transcriptional regulator n=1 Tax=Sulfitobacter sp. TaxID=1903071 RepID=UPI003003148A